MKIEKLFVYLAKAENLAHVFKNLKLDYIKFFKKSEPFRGVKKTYTQDENTVDDPSKRGYQAVVATVPEKLKYFEEVAIPYIDTLFVVERTNSSGNAKAELVVDGQSWGEFTSLELMRLHSLLEDESFKTMYAELPVRSEVKNWTLSETEGIWEDQMITTPNMTTEKESYILPDPNLSKIDGSKYIPQIAQRETRKRLGLATVQNYSGEISHAERAKILSRISNLKIAVQVALKKANDCPVVESQMNGKRLFDYLHKLN